MLVAQPESGMGYQICDIELNYGRVFHRVVITGGFVTSCEGSTDMPFAALQIDRITVTHER
jgi:hypothetical protein